MPGTEKHQPLCTIELVAEGHATRCPGVACPFWEDGCVLSRIEAELDGRPELAGLLLAVRRELEAAKYLVAGEARAQVRRRLAEGRE